METEGRAVEAMRRRRRRRRRREKARERQRQGSRREDGDVSEVAVKRNEE